MPDDRPVNRRAFFRAGLRELLKPLVNAVEPVEEAVRQLQIFEAPNTMPRQSPPRALHREVWLRPPGALLEQQFLDTCSRCGKCAEVCPAQCIKLDPTSVNGGGAPFIQPDVMGCVVCESLACMHHCPSGALLPTALAEIDMGTAEWRPASCVRTTRGEDCTICIDHCPLGSAAIELRDNRVHVIDDGCIGCGVCQHDCPTTPKSITVIPRAGRT